MASSSSLRLGLRSYNTAKYVKHTTRTKLGQRAFSYAGPAAWNALVDSLHDITDIGKFTKSLKIVLFERAFPTACFSVLLSCLL